MFHRHPYTKDAHSRAKYWSERFEENQEKLSSYYSRLRNYQQPPLTTEERYELSELLLHLNSYSTLLATDVRVLDAEVQHFNKLPWYKKLFLKFD